MPTDPALILHQWFSPSFPVGAFAYSHGLEAAIADDLVNDAAGLQAWVDDVLRHGGARSDAILLRLAYAEGPAVDARARAYAPSAERLSEADLQGAAFCQTLEASEAMTLGRLTYPVAVGVAARAKDLPLDLTVSLYLQAFVANLVSAAIRLVPLGQTDGQRVLNGLRDTVTDVARDTAGATEEDLHGLGWMSDIAAMRHETMTTRIFKT